MNSQIFICQTCSEKNLNTFVKFNPEKIKNDEKCKICLDLFSENTKNSVLNKVKEYLSLSNFEFDDFSVAISFPLIFYAHIISRSTNPNVTEIEKLASFLKVELRETYGLLFSTILNKKYSQKSSFQIFLSINHSADILLKRTLKFSKTLLNNFLEDPAISNIKEFENNNINDFNFDFDVKCCHKDIYITGLYMKYSRNLSQTPWWVDSKDSPQTSIEEIIMKAVRIYFACDAKFSASGREDIDVRMLGKGRPFVLKCFNHKTDKLDKSTLENIKNEVNKSSDLQISDLYLINGDVTKLLNESSHTKRKSYSSSIKTDKNINIDKIKYLNGLSDLQIYQWTPIRVLHRRPLLNRARKIYNLKIEKLDEFLYKLFLTTEAGTYVKEFVNGDFGRTQPNLSTLLGCRTDILELDVENIEMEWPPNEYL